MSRFLDYRTAFVITLAREIQEAGDDWAPDYDDLEARTGYRRSWCEKAVAEARRLADQTNGVNLTRFERAQMILAERPDTSGAELGRLLGITGRRGAQLRRKVLQVNPAKASSRADASASSPHALMAAAQDAVRDGDTARAAQLSIVLIAHSLVRIADALKKE